MDVYLVGGAIRDELLGRPVRERDWVVVGATPKELILQGFKPVGNDFPVFLHPETGEEYALARTERKSGHGYRGFKFRATPKVTLEQDLVRRDLTINAIARSNDGTLIDPYNGQRDLQDRVLRHVSDAFVEDPLRVLRVARFAARYRSLGFRIADETLELMTRITLSGELRYLTPERIWKELSRAMMERSPQAFLSVLHDCGALADVLPEIANLDGVPQPLDHHPSVDALHHLYRCLMQAEHQKLSLTARYALLCHDLGKTMTLPASWPGHRGHEHYGETLTKELSGRIKAPLEMRETALLLVRFQRQAQNALHLPNGALFQLLKDLDALRRPRRMKFFLDAAEACFRACNAERDKPFPQALFLRGALDIMRGITGSALKEEGLSGPELGQALEEKRIQALGKYRKEFIKQWKASRSGRLPL